MRPSKRFLHQLLTMPDQKHRELDDHDRNKPSNSNEFQSSGSFCQLVLSRVL